MILYLGLIFAIAISIILIIYGLWAQSKALRYNDVSLGRKGYVCFRVGEVGLIITFIPLLCYLYGLI